MCCITQGAPTGTLWQPRGVEGGWREEEGQDGGDVCIPMVDSYWCMAETNTILQNNCPSIKNKFLKMETTREMWSLLSLRVCMPSGLSHVWLFATLWTVTCQAPLSMGFSRQEYWSGLPFPSPGDLPNPEIELVSAASPALQQILYPLRHLKSPFSLPKDIIHFHSKQ